MDSLYVHWYDVPNRQTLKPDADRLMGSLTNYRRLLLDVDSPFLRDNPQITTPGVRFELDPIPKLSSVGHGVAGIFAGWVGWFVALQKKIGWLTYCFQTVCCIAAPVEHIKARLQVQYHGRKSADLTRPRYTGPIDCCLKIAREHGITSLWHGFRATLIFRTFFFFWWSSYDIFTRYLTDNTNLSVPAVNFWAGGLSAQVFWLTSYPSDVVKQQIMTDELGKERKYPTWSSAVRAVYRKSGYRGFWRGFVPSFLRAFPANAAALVVFEGVMRGLQSVDHEERLWAFCIKSI
jgi:solute carrier family 25 (mitochondrial carnitine/acylcarnitine transporter), member 20/29